MQPFLFCRRRKGSSKPGIWTIVYEEGGERKQAATKFREPDEAKAKAVLRLFIEGRARQGRIEGSTEGAGPFTVARLAADWLASRMKKGISTAGDYRTRIETHVLPVALLEGATFGQLRADRVRLEHIEQVMAAMKAKGEPPASRSQLRVYEAMTAMFNWAVPRLLEASPCRLKAEELPADKDANPEWRGTALFERDEVVAILTDRRIPVDRRVFYAVSFLTGCRFGEVSALCVRHYKRDWEPLAGLDIARSYNSKQRRVKDTKTGKARLVPVHPLLALIINWWLDVGWPEMMGRLPGPADVLIPTRNGGHRDGSTTWRQFNGERDKHGVTVQLGDLERIGLRRRRQHDARRTFTTLIRRDGGRKDLVQLITHGPAGDIVDVYTEMRAMWQPLCRQVAKLKIDLSKSAKPFEPGAGEVAKEVAMSDFLSVVGGLQSDPSGIRTRPGAAAKDGQTLPVAAKRRNPAVSPPRERSAIASIGAQPRPMATLATLALRQALAALDRGRVDQARDILERAIKEEAADDAEAVS
jgi:integrase